MRKTNYCILFIFLLTFLSKNAFSWNTPMEVSPVNGSDSWAGVTLDWMAVENSEKYQVQVDTSLFFNSPVLHSEFKNYINNSSFNMDTQEWLDNLYFGKKYYWRVRALISGDTSAWSPIWNFTTRDYVRMNTPDSGATVWTGVTLDWFTHDGVDYYDLQVDTTPLFASPLLKSYTTNYLNTLSTNPDTEKWIKELYFGQVYYWRVRARNAVDTTTWSPVWHFITNNSVELVAPSDGLLNLTMNGTVLDWQSHHGIYYYQVQMDTVNIFNSPFLSSVNKPYINTDNTNSDTEFHTGPLTADKIYFWRVRAINLTDTSVWVTRSFSTGNVPVIIPSAPLPNAPNNNANGVGHTVTLQWTLVNNANTYEFDFDTTATFSTSISGYTALTETTLNNLVINKNYYWRVRSRIATNIYSDWSDIWTFKTDSGVCNTYNLNEQVIVCLGSSYTFPDNVTVDFIIAPFSHTSQLISSQQCDSIITTYVSIDSIDAGISLVGNTFTANSSGMMYQWVDCNNGFTDIPNETNQLFTPTVSGSYAVIVSDSICSRISACYPVNIVSIENKENNSTLRLFPNPSQGSFKIEIPEKADNIILEVFTTSGRQVYLQQFSDSRLLTVNTGLSAGIYMIKMTYGTLYSYSKLVIF